MPQHGFHRDAYIREFTARVTACEPVGDFWRANLAETWFYPDSGGQPADRGSIAGVGVIDVWLDGDEVQHILDGPLEPGTYAAAIDWARRYDHMQQHTGQHLLTAALFTLFGAETVSFHLGEATSTIDITLPALSPAQIRKAEEFCAARIGSGLPVTSEWIDAETFRALPLRKKALPDHVEGDIRLIRIGDLDTVHCGGTHVRSTAELHAIKITATEKVRETTRVHFLAGGRALADHAAKHDLLTGLAAELTCAIPEIAGVVAKLREENRESANRVKKLTRELAGLRAASDLTHAREHGDRKILVRRYDDLDPASLKSLAGELTAAEPKLLFCGAGVFQERCHLVCAAGAGFNGDLGPLMQRLLPAINGRGGGRGNFTQGAGEPAHIDELLRSAEAALVEL